MGHRSGDEKEEKQCRRDHLQPRGRNDHPTINRGGVGERRAAEQNPAKYDEQERSKTLQKDRKPVPPGTAIAISDEQQSVEPSPDYERPTGPVPETTEEH